MMVGGILGFVPMILAFFFMEESPRWLVSRGRQLEAEKSVHDLCGVDVDLGAVVTAEGAAASRKTSVLETLTACVKSQS